MLCVVRADLPMLLPSYPASTKSQVGAVMRDSETSAAAGARPGEATMTLPWLTTRTPAREDATTSPLLLARASDREDTTTSPLLLTRTSDGENATTSPLLARTSDREDATTSPLLVTRTSEQSQELFVVDAQGSLSPPKPCVVVFPALPTVL